MSKGKRYEVSLTENELKVVVEGLALFKRQLKSKADKMRKAHGHNNKGKHTQRYNYMRTATRKFSSQLPQPNSKKLMSVFGVDILRPHQLIWVTSECCQAQALPNIEYEEPYMLVSFTCLNCNQKCRKKGVKRGQER